MNLCQVVYCSLAPNLPFACFVILDVVSIFPLPSDMILTSTSRGRRRNSDEGRLLRAWVLAYHQVSTAPLWVSSHWVPSASLWAASQNHSGFLVSFISPPILHSSTSSFLHASPSVDSNSANFVIQWHKPSHTLPYSPIISPGGKEGLFQILSFLECFASTLEVVAVPYIGYRSLLEFPSPLSS